MNDYYLDWGLVKQTNSFLKKETFYFVLKCGVRLLAILFNIHLWQVRNVSADLLEAKERERESEFAKIHSDDLDYLWITCSLECYSQISSYPLPKTESQEVILLIYSRNANDLAHSRKTYLGLPRPLTGSQPMAASKARLEQPPPLVPTMISWKVVGS